jgi:hypothetical protein
MDPLERSFLGPGELRRSRLRGQGRRHGHLPPLAAPCPLLWRDQRQRAGGRGAVVVGEPESEVDERRRERLQHPLGRNGLDVGRRLGIGVHDNAAPTRVAEGDREHGALPHVVGDLVRERPRERARADDRVDGREAGHGQRA